MSMMADVNTFMFSLKMMALAAPDTAVWRTKTDNESDRHSATMTETVGPYIV